MIELGKIKNLQVRNALERVNFNHEGEAQKHLDEKEVALLDANGDQSFTADDVKLMGLDPELYEPIKEVLDQHTESVSRAFQNNIKRFDWGPLQQALSAYSTRFPKMDPRRAAIARLLGEYLVQAEAWVWAGDAKMVNNYLKRDAIDRQYGYYTELMKDKDRESIKFARVIDPELGRRVQGLINQIYKMKLVHPFSDYEQRIPNPDKKAQRQATLDMIRSFNDEYLQSLGFALIFTNKILPVSADIFSTPLPFAIEKFEAHPWEGKDGALLSLNHLRLLTPHSKDSIPSILFDGSTRVDPEQLSSRDWLGYDGPRVFLDVVDLRVEEVREILKQDASKDGPYDRLVRVQFSIPPYFVNGTYDSEAIREAIIEVTRVHEFQHIYDHSRGEGEHSETEARLTGLRDGKLPLYALWFDFKSTVRVSGGFFSEPTLEPSSCFSDSENQRCNYTYQIARSVDTLYQFLEGPSNSNFHQKMSFLMDESIRRFRSVDQAAHIFSGLRGAKAR